MGGKLLIRRKGSLIPIVSLGLAGILLFVLGWLCTVGLPDCALRAIERKAGEHGVNLSLGKVRLDIDSGFAISAYRVAVEIPQGELPPLRLSVYKARLHPDFLRMSLSKVTFFRTEGQFPLAQGESMSPFFNLKVGELSLPSDGRAIHFSTSGTICCLNTDISLDLPLPLFPHAAETAEDNSFDANQWMTENRPLLRRLWHQVEEQHFDEGYTPHLKLVLDLRNAEEPKGFLSAHVPRLLYQDGEIDRLDVNATLQQNILTLSKAAVSVVKKDVPEQEREKKSLNLHCSGYFNLADGGTSLRVHLQGIPETLANFTPSSIDDLILRKYGVKADSPFLLNIGATCTLTPPEAPSEKDIDTLQQHGLPIAALIKRLEPYTRLTQESVDNLRLEGDISQGPFALRHRSFRGFSTSFLIGDGYYNLSHLRLLLANNGSLSGSYTIGKEKGSARFSLRSSAEELQQLAYALTGEDFSLPPDVNVGGDILLNAKADLSASRFYPGTTDPQQLIPTLHSLAIEASVGSFSRLLQYDVQSPEIFLLLRDLQYTTDSMFFAAGRAELFARVDDLRLADENAANAPLLPPEVAEIEGKDLSFRLTADHFSYNGDTLSADHADTEMSVGRGEVRLVDAEAPSLRQDNVLLENFFTRLSTEDLVCGLTDEAEQQLYERVQQAVDKSEEDRQAELLARRAFLSSTHLADYKVSFGHPSAELGIEHFGVTRPEKAGQVLLPPGSLNNCRLELAADAIAYAPPGPASAARHVLSVDNASGALTGDSFGIDNALLKGFELRFRGVDVSEDMPTLLPLNTELLAKLDSYTVTIGDEEKGVRNPELRLEPDRGADPVHPAFAATLKLGQGEEEKELHLQLKNRVLNEEEASALFPARREREYLWIPGGQKLNIPWNTLCGMLKELRSPSGEPLLTSEDLLEDRLRLPDDFTLTTDDSYFLLGPHPQLLCLGLSMDIPRLTSLPTQPVLRDSPVTVGLHLHTRLTKNLKAGYTLTGDTLMTESGNTFKADFRYDTDACRIRVTDGTCTITADKIDRLIDLPDAHNIIRDFHFIPGTSSLSATNIAVDIDYKDAVKVLVKCDADIRNLDYQMMGYEDTLGADGVTITAEKKNPSTESEPCPRIAQATCNVTVDLQYYDEPGKDVQLVTLGNPVLRCDNRPWLQAKGLEGTASNTESTITGESVVFDLEKDALYLNKLRGTCYPSYSFGMFYPDLYDYLRDIILLSPVAVNTEQCTFPLTTTTPTAMTGTIEVCMPPNQSGFYRLAGVDIPLRHFSGMVTLTDKAVFLRELNALTWGGVLNGQMSIGWAGQHTSFDGEMTARNMLLPRIARSVSAQMPEGLCNGYIRFHSTSADLRALQAYGQVSIEDSDLRQLSLFSTVDAVLDDINSGSLGVEKSVTDFLLRKSAHSSEKFNSPDGGRSRPTSTTFSRAISNLYDGNGFIDIKSWPLINRTLKYDLQDAHMPFTIEDGVLRLNGGQASGLNLTLGMDVGIRLDNMGLSGTLRPKFYHLGFPFGIQVGGTLSDVRYSIWGTVENDAEEVWHNLKLNLEDSEASPNKNVNPSAPRPELLNSNSLKERGFFLWR